MLKQLALIPLVLGLSVGLALADSDAIVKRKEILKGFGQATRPVAAMLKGNVPFDLAIVKDTLGKYSAGSKKLTGLFPDDSKTGGETEALPSIWEQKAKFESLYQKLDHDATAASASIVDLASLKAQMPKVLGSCKACHDEFRAKD